jgi:tetratricopeptide (TPR) repeat protein
VYFGLMVRAILTLLLLPCAIVAQGASADTLRQALALFNSGKYQESFELVSLYLPQAPNSATAYKLLGMNEYMLGHPREALASVTRATELAPNDADAQYYLGRLYFSTDKIPAALTTFQRTISLDPSSVRAYNYLGQTYEALGRREDAEKAYLKAIELDKDQPKKSGWPDYNLGVLCLDNGRTADSITAFRRALEVNPAFPEAKIKLAVALSKEQPVPEAFELLRQALATDPGNAEGHYRLALLLTKSGKREEAQEQFELFQKYRKP